MTVAMGGLGFLIAGSATAHDFFLVPEKFVGASGPLIVHATSSSDFPELNIGSPQSRIAEVRAVVGDHPAAVEVQEKTAKSLRFAVSSDTTGMGVVALRTVWGETSWGPDMVDAYLDEHPFKADDVARVRRLLPKGATLQVRSRRLAKTLVCAHACTPPTNAVAGLEVELVPEFDATGASPVRAQLIRDGRSLAAHPVTLRAADGQRLNLVTDDEGWVRLPAKLSGPVMLVAVTLDPPTKPGNRFTTNNATLTFEARGNRTAD